jgi:hypothetical protein
LPNLTGRNGFRSFMAGLKIAADGAQENYLKKPRHIHGQNARRDLVVHPLFYLRMIIRRTQRNPVPEPDIV